VFQDYALFPHLTVRQNIAFGRRRGWLNPARSFNEASVERWIATFHLEAVSGHYPHQISGGQRQRTALARSLVNDPSALLLDEPFAALDKDLRQRLRGELKELQEQLRIPMLMITHDDDDVRVMADEVVHLRGGSVADAQPNREQAIAE
jgi:molybdate transport system ATP-binding protein